MKTHRLAPLALIAIVLVACASSGPVITTLHVIEHAETDAVGDVAPEGDSIGDTLGFANPVYDESNTQQLGTDNGFCVRTAVGEAWECVWTINLALGHMPAEGPFYDAKDSTLAITGGTGEYSQVRGEMTLHARNAQGTEFDFTYTIIK